MTSSVIQPATHPTSFRFQEDDGEEEYGVGSTSERVRCSDIRDDTQRLAKKMEEGKTPSPQEYLQSSSKKPTVETEKERKERKENMKDLEVGFMTRISQQCISESNCSIFSRG